jgi:predicted DsbA family dithiol-disulfide isomerase
VSCPPLGLSLSRRPSVNVVGSVSQPPLSSRDIDMFRPRRPLEIAVYQDVFCAWCYVAEARLELVRRELGDLVRWSWRPYALRVDDRPLTAREQEARIQALRAARQEPEGARLSEEIWTLEQAPRSTLPALVALEAARLLGRDAFHAMMGALRRAALEQGIDVTRLDVLLEIGSTLHLDVRRFGLAMQSDQTRRWVLHEQRLARARGVKGVPALVLGGRWMVAGLRDVAEYRALILDCVAKHGAGQSGSSDQLIH